jgi:tight adherence protein C
MIVYIYLLLISGSALILGGLFWPTRYRHIRLKLPQDGRQLNRIKIHSYLARIFPFTQKLLESLKLEAKVKNKLDAAHLRLTPQEFFNIKLLLIVILTIILFFALGKLDPRLFFAAFVLGYVMPDLFVNRKIGQRKFNIARLLPETVDLLGLCVEAGLDFTTAVRWIIEKTPANPMLDELAFVLEEIKWGKPRTQALRDMSKRLGIPEVSSFVQTLVQAERMGTPVAEAFGILSEDTRLQRFHRGERIAMQAPIKILIPLIFCILPVIAIVIGGPIFLQFMQGGILQSLGR